MKRIILPLCLCIVFGCFSGCRNIGDSEDTQNDLDNKVVDNDVEVNIPEDSANGDMNNIETETDTEHVDDSGEITVTLPDEIVEIINDLDTSEKVINLGASLFSEYIVTPLCLDIIFTPFESFSELPTGTISAYIKGKFADLPELDTYFPDGANAPQMCLSLKR